MKFLLASLLVGCTDVSLVLVHDSGNTAAVGEGLEAVFFAYEKTCEPGDPYPACSSMVPAALAPVEVHDGLGLVSQRGNEFRVYGATLGEGHTHIEAGDLSESIEMAVLPIAYTRISRRDDDFDHRIPDDQPLPAFPGAAFEVWQEHYFEPRAYLDQTTWMDHLEVRLNGYAELTLLAGATEAALVPIQDDHVIQRHPRHTLAVGGSLGTAKLTTAVGGSLPVEVVDESAIAAIEILEPSRLADRYAYPQPLFLQANAATGRGIAGCPPVAPKVFDTEGVFVVTTTEGCRIDLAIAEGRTFGPTTLVVEWAGHRLELPI